MFIDYWRFARTHPRFLGFGFLMAFLSSAGQTYFIGVFGAEIQSEFGLDSGSWGRIYMMGTLASALVINWSGSLLDRFDLRWFTAFSLTGLSLACLMISSADSMVMLVLAIFMLRQFGQGLTSHTGLTSMARYHQADRGKAIALAAIGFALLLATCFMFKGNINWRNGFLWGLGGFVAFQLAPSVGLPPELPGTEAAALEARQTWWIATAVFTAVGLLLVFNTQHLLLKGIGVLFMAVPQIVGAPQPLEHSALAPQSLVTQFIVLTTIIGAVFWMSLGALTAFAHNKLSNLSS